MDYLVIIGDIIASRTIAERDTLQRRLSLALRHRNRARPPDSLVSPFTLTLGDEFQVVASNAKDIFRDILHIAADLHPVEIRFSLGLGGISTAINPEQAIGMDGTAFHRARDGIEWLKQHREQCRVNGLDPLEMTLVNSALALAFGRLRGARGSRLPLVAGLLEGLTVGEIAERLGKTEQTLYKTMRTADLQAMVTFLGAVEALIDQALTQRGDDRG